MKPARALDWTWVDPRGRIGQQELADSCGLTAAEVDELVGHGGLVPLAGGQGERQFGATCVAPLREALRLKAHYHLDLFTVSLLVGYLQRITQLEQRVHSLHARVQHQHALPREGPSPWHEPHCA